MANQKLSEAEIAEIRLALQGIQGSEKASTVKSLSAHYKISSTRIYAITNDQTPRRKRRTDKGNRKYNLSNNPTFRHAIELVFFKQFTPKLALETAQKEICSIPLSLGTFRKYLHELGIFKSSKIKREKISNRLLEKLPSTYSNKELQLLIEKGVHLENVVSIAIERIEDSLSSEDMFQFGNLLLSVLSIKQNFWKEHPVLFSRFLKITDLVQPLVYNLQIELSRFNSQIKR